MRNEIRMIRKITMFSLVLFSCAIFMACGHEHRTESETPEKKEEMMVNPGQQESAGRQVILFFGNSLTAGYGLEPGESFPSLIQERLDSLGLPWEVVNAGLSGETTAGGVGRIDWILGQRIDIFVLELGGNDMLRGLDVTETEKNLRTILERVRNEKTGIPVIVAGMKAPPNMGKAYTDRFEGIYPKLADEFDAGLIPFFLDGVGGIDSLNLPDGIHPNAAGQRIVMENVWSELKKSL